MSRKSGGELFHDCGNPSEVSVRDFWTWAHSDLLNNTAHGILAEFIVASALGVAEGTRIEWDAKDIVTPSGLGIEVKSAAYIQTWEQTKLSKVGFDIAKKYAWDAETNTTSETKVRSSDLYVFCLLAEKEQGKVDPMDLSQWKFYVVGSRRLDEELGGQKRISLGRLESLGVKPVGFRELADEIEASLRWH